VTDPQGRLTAALTDRYRIERELGQGGMATVYLAHDLKHDRAVALKVLRPELAVTLGLERFQTEIKTTARLHHPHILPLYDSGEAGGQLFYVMPLVDGESLRDRLTREKQLPLADALRITREVAEALAYAHARNVIHRDIKPENILLEGGHALVADFGIARAVSAGGDPRLTQTGHSIGTPVYMSPEQAAGDPDLDGRSDLYSLAGVLFEMLAGEPPFTGATPEAILVQRFTQAAPRISTKRTGIPAPIDVALQRALDRDPAERHATIERFAETLQQTSAPAGGTAEKSIAVLAFENMSADPENSYFGDGIAEDIINALTQLGGLRVAARTSAFAFKGKQADLRRIGETLNVATVLEGSVRKTGTRLRITAQLINVTDGYHLWSERYDRELTDVFAIQDEIATAIAAKLQVTFAKPVEDRAPRPMTARVEAYELYLRGQALVRQRGPAALRGLTCFEEAIALDPDYALAHAGLADALRILAGFGLARPTEVLPRAKAALGRALDLEPNLAEALATQGLIALMHDHDVVTGMATLDRALQLNPQLLWARGLYALYGLAAVRDDFAGALAEADRVVADDPLNFDGVAIRSLILGSGGRHQEAIAEAKHARELDQDAFMPHMGLVIAAVWGSDPTQGIPAARSLLQVSGRNPWVLAYLAQLFAIAGDPERATATHRELLARAGTEYVPSTYLAMSAMAAGAQDEVLGFGMRAVDDRENVLPSFFGPFSLRLHPAFDELRRRVGL